MSSTARQIRRGTLIRKIDSSGSLVTMVKVKGGNGKITKCKRKRMPPKLKVVSVDQFMGEHLKKAGNNATLVQ